MPPKAKKEKVVEEEPPKATGKFPPIEIDFKITHIENFNANDYSEYTIDFSHKEIPLLIRSMTGHDNCYSYDNMGGGDTYIDPNIDDANKHIISNLNTAYYFMFDRNTIDDINKLCDCPLFVGLYGVEKPIEEEVIIVEQPIEPPVVKPPNKSDKKASKNEPIEPPPVIIPKIKKLLAYNFIDILHWIRKRPIDVTEKLFLYFDPIAPSLITPSIDIHVVSKRRLLLNEYIFPNLCYITLESIFNIHKIISEDDSASIRTKQSNKSKRSSKTASSKMSEDTAPPAKQRIENFIVKFSLIKSNENLEQIKEHLCTFTNGHYCIINSDEPLLYKKWDSIPNLYGSGALTNMKSKRPLKSEIFQEDNYLDLSKFDFNSEVYAFNSMHRYLMPIDVCKNLEKLITEENYQIMIEIKFDGNEDVQLVGYADLSPILYPDVSSGRFLVILKKVLPEEKEPTRNSGRKSLKKDRRSKMKSMQQMASFSQTFVEKSVESSIFLIFEMKFHTPLSVISKISIDPEHFRISEKGKFELPRLTIEEISHSTLINFENEVLTIVKQLPKYLTGAIINDDIICKDTLCQDCLQEMQSNLVDNISRLISFIYNIRYPTKNNAEFRNLMTIVYNELIEKIEKIINDYYLGIDNSAKVIDDPQQKNLNIFSYWEIQEVTEFIGKSWISIRPDVILSTEDLFDAIMTNLHYCNFDEAQKHLDELLKRNHVHYYGSLARLYFIYLNSEIDVFIAETMKVLQIHPINSKIWCLLYTIFDNANYRAGAKYAKMKFTVLKRQKPYFWDRQFIYFTQPKNLSESKPLCDSVYIFLKAGFFKFAQLVYDKCQLQFDPIDELRLNYLCKYNLHDFDGLKIDLETTRETEDNKLIIKLFWGHYYFATDNKKLAKINYEYFFHSPHKTGYLYDHLAFLRLGFMEIEEKNYENGETYFVSCARETNSMITWYGLGICLYRSDKLLKARQCFSKVTQYQSIKLPETWLYLAMISVKLKEPELAKTFLNLAEMIADTTLYGLDTKVWNETKAIFHENFIKFKR